MLSTNAAIAEPVESHLNDLVGVFLDGAGAGDEPMVWGGRAR